jgi:hypothetical protein
MADDVPLSVAVDRIESDIDEFAKLILVFMQTAGKPLHRDFILSRCADAIMRCGSATAAISAIRDGSFPIYDV